MYLIEVVGKWKFEIEQTYQAVESNTGINGISTGCIIVRNSET